MKNAENFWTLSSKNNGLAAVLIATVCVITAIAHWPAINTKALSTDDQQYVTSNVLVQTPGWKSAKRFLTEVLEPSTVKGYYQPLTMISLMLDYAAGGRENNLQPFHSTSLALHATNTALIIVLLYMLFGNIWAAAAMGLLFGVHPLTVEPIVWVAARKTLLATFFSLWSLFFYVRYSNRGGWKYYSGCFLTYLFALMSQPTSIPLPAAMLLMDCWPLKRLSIKTILEKTPLFMLGVIFAVITYISQYRTAAIVSPKDFPGEYIPLVLCHNIIFYLHKIILPVNLSSYYAFPDPFNLSNPAIISGVVGTIVLLSSLLISLRWTHAAFIGWLIFFAMIFPTMGVVGFNYVIVYDKYAYLPCIGLLMTATFFLIWLCKNDKIKIIATVVVLMLAGAEASATQHYLAYWENSIKLVNYMLESAPNAAVLYHSRGIAYYKKGELNLALKDLNKAIELNPKYYEAHYDLGVIYGKMGRLENEIEAYKRAIKTGARFSQSSYYNLGTAFLEVGQYQEAIEAFQQAIKIKPDYAEAYCNLGGAYASQSKWLQAVETFEHAVTLNPTDAKMYYDLGIAYGKMGRFEDEIKAYRNAIKGKPYAAEIFNNLGIACYNLGRNDEAIAAFMQAIKIQPDYADVYYNLGLLFDQLGRYQESIGSFKQAVRVKPDFAEAHYSLGSTYSKVGDSNSALAEYEILKNLGNSKATELLNLINK